MDRPIALLRREVQHGQRAWRLAEHGAAERHRILRRCGRELVDEALDDEVVMGDAHPAPETGVEHGLLVAHVLDLDRRDVVEHLAGPEELGNGGRVQWVAGRPGEAPAYAGTDFIIARDGRIAALYLFFDKLR